VEGPSTTGLRGKTQYGGRIPGESAPGAIGAGGTREKDIVLQIALRLARKLREELRLDVVLTRSTDVFLELQERTAIANQVGADLFVSIHANASMNRNASGMETYYLNLAKTEKVAQLAAKENGTPGKFLIDSAPLTLQNVRIMRAVAEILAKHCLRPANAFFALITCGCCRIALLASPKGSPGACLLQARGAWQPILNVRSCFHA
jgi:hypothetical protein